MKIAMVIHRQKLGQTLNKRIKQDIYISIGTCNDILCKPF